MKLDTTSLSYIKKSLVLILIGLKKACIHFLKSIYFKYFKMSLLKNVTLFFTIANCLLWYLGWKQFLQNIVQEHIADPCLLSWSFIISVRAKELPDISDQNLSISNKNFIKMLIQILKRCLLKLSGFSQ